MRNCLKTIISISALVSVLGLNSSVFGVAAFARQTGLDCTSCHTSAGFPTLNTFGAAFKAGGYVNGDDANMMGDGEALSIPKTLGLSIVGKIRAKYVVSGDGRVGEDHAGELHMDMPDEYVLMMGGRVSKNIGYLTEFNMLAGMEPGLGAVRLPIVFDVGPGKLGAVIWAAGDFGPTTVFEYAATGAQKNLRVFENVKPFSQDSSADETASGLGAYYYHSMFFVAYTPYTNSLGGAHRSMAHYARVAVTPNVAGLDLLVGGQIMMGDAGSVLPGGKEIQSSSAIDAQVAGTLGVPMLIFFQYTTIGENDFSNPIGESTGIRVGVDAQLIENTLNVGAGFIMNQYAYPAAISNAPAVDAENAIVGVVKYNLARNLRLNVEYKHSLTAYDAAAGTGSDISFAQAMLFGSW